MLTGSSDKTARLWDPETGQCKQILEGHTDEIFSCAFNYEGNTIITGKIMCCKSKHGQLFIEWTFLSLWIG